MGLPCGSELNFGYNIAGTKDHGDGNNGLWLIKTDEFGVITQASWQTLPILLVATSAIFIYKKSLHRKNSEGY